MESHLRAIEVYRYAKVLHEIAAEYSALLETGCFVDRAEIQHQRANIFTLEISDSTLANEQQGNIMGYACCAEYSRSFAFYYLCAHVQSLYGSD
jgi:hypothetical protein